MSRPAISRLVLIGLVLPTAFAGVPDVPLPPAPPRKLRYQYSWSVPAARIRERAARGAPRAQAIGALARELAIPDRAAGPMLEAVEIQHFLDSRVPMGAIRPREFAQLEAALGTALDVVPAARPPLDLLLRHVCRRTELAPDAARQLLARTARRTDQSLQAVTAGDWFSLAPFAWDQHSRALRQQPGHPALLHSLAEMVTADRDRRPWGSPQTIFALELALREAALSALLERPARSTRLAAALASELLDTELRFGRTAAAVAILDSLPADVRGTLLSGEQAALADTIEGLPLRAVLSDLRPALAAALALEGRAQQARAMLQRVSLDERALPAVPGSYESVEFYRLEAGIRRARQWRLVAEILSPGDPFEAIVETYEEGESRETFRDGIWRRLLFALARRHGLDATMLATEVLDRYASIGRLDTAWSGRGDPSCWTRALAIDAEIAEERRVAERELPAPSTGPNDRAARVVRAVVRAPLDLAEPLPLAVQPSEPSREELSRHRQAITSALAWPHGFNPIRFEMRGNTVTAIGGWRGFDPTGELPIRGYWVVQSDDGGRSWDAPLFTGHSAHVPYVVAPLSRLPLVENEQLTLEVAARPIAADSVTFPPLFLRSAHVVKGLVLRIPLAELRRDRDGDGLSDRIERALFTDPDDPDTDGDGQDDGSDQLPQIPAGRSTPSAEGTVLAALVESWTVDRATRWRREARREPPTSALFLVAHRSSLHGVVMRRRVIVLEPDEATALARTTPFYPYRVQILFDRSQRRALAIWDERWRGGTVRLSRWFGRWHRRTITTWVT